VPHLTIPEKLQGFLTKKKRFKIAFGGRGAAKSQSFADIFLLKSQTEKAKTGCFREMQNSIEDSVHSLLKSEINRLELDGFTSEKATIYNNQGGEFRFKGLARNPDAVKSMHGFKYFWIEEGQSISQESLNMLTPTLREADSELWVSMNPQSSEDPMSKRFIKPFESELKSRGYYEDDLHLIVWINYTDNPWFPEALEQERLWDYENKSRAEYDHIWLGHFNDSIENSIIKAEWFDAAIDSHKKLGFKPKGVKVASHDPSDEGGDGKGFALRHGSVVLDVQENNDLDVNDGLDWATDLTINNNADHFIWDGDGLGLSLKRQVSTTFNGKHCKYHIFHGGGGVDNPNALYMNEDFQGTGKRENKNAFKNKRAQYYWMLRDKFYNTYRAVEHGEYKDPDDLISLSSEITTLTKLRSELCRIPRRPNGNGLIQIMSKQDMKAKHKIDSPNLADSLMMSYLDGLTIADSWSKPLTYKKYNRV